MKLVTLLLILMLSAVSDAGQKGSRELPKTVGPWIVMAYYSDKSQVLGIRDELDVWKVDQKNQSVMMVVRDLVEYQQLLDNGFRIKINQAMMDEYANIEKNNWRSTDTIPGFACYRTVEETYVVMDSLVSNNPTLASIVDIGDSWDKVTAGGNPGYDLRVIKITNQNVIDPDKPILYAMGSIHSREYPPAELVTRFSEYLINNYNIDADVTWLVDHHEIHLLLQGNPDGRKISEAEAFPNQRKNRNANHCPEPNAAFEQQGVDMNRNFPFKWNQGSGSSGNPCSQVYRGLSALSEPENFAIDAYIKTLFPDERPDDITIAAPLNKPGVYLDIHNVANVILFPFGYDNNNPLSPNHDQLLTLGRRMGFYNNYPSGTAESILGPADGASEDNAYGTLGVAAYTFELGEGGFYSSCNSFENTIWPDNLPALIYAAKASRMPYVTPAGPDSINLVLDVQQILAGDLINISGTATDLQFNNNGTAGNEITHNISSVNVFLNLAPWQSGASAIVATASDGSFDSSSESFTAQIITEGLLAGNHMLFVESTDASGVTGVPSAIFFEVIDPGNLGTLQGTVTDVLTNNPIDTASLDFNGLNESSNALGQYSFSALAGSSDLSVTKSGYVPQTLNNLSIVAGQSTVQNVQLQPLCSLIDDNLEAYANTGDAVTAGWSHQASQGIDDWRIENGDDNTVGNGKSFVTSDVDSVSDKRLISPVFSVSTNASLSFWHKHAFEAGIEFYDGAVIEITTDAGANWADLGSQITSNGYNGTLNGGDGQPLGAVNAFVGNLGTFTQVEVDLSNFSNQTIQIRWRLGTDNNTGGGDWLIDDIQLLDPSACQGPVDLIFADGFEQ